MRFGLVFLAMGVVACSDDEDKSVRVEPESTPPTLNVTAPADGATLNHSDAVVLEATVEDNEDLPNEVALIWESDIDGVFSTDGADSTGGVTVSIDSLSAGDHVVTVTATDTDGLFVTDTVSFNLNEPPTAPTVTLEPSPATTDQMLVATVSESVDPEGTDTVTFAYEWLEDGVPSAESSSATFPAAATSKHHTYRVQVTASDERFESAFGYAETSVINAEPVLSGPALSSDTAVVGDVLTCTATATDADPTDSPTITYAWSDGSTEPTYTVTVSDAVGSTITCTATADDADGGIATGTATATVANTAPVGETVAVTPLEGQVGAILTCTATASDADGETPTMTYEWTGGATGPEYTIAETDDPGDVIACTATATDAHGLTDTGTATATVVNTDPTIDAVTIGPDPAYNNDTLVCSTTATDADGGSPSIAYEWTGGATGPELPLTSIVAAPGDTIACTATATDTDGGTDTGSASIVIGNRAPEVSSVTLSPSDVYTNDTITATATTSDDDGDSLTVTYDFSVDGTSVQDGSTNTLDGAVYFDKGQSVSVTVTADDGTEASTLTSDLVLVSNTTPTAPEVTILEGLSPIITSGEEHSCALSVTGEIDCWGSDSNGQVSGVPSASFIAVSAGGTHTCAISPEKEINCWGSDLFGQVTEAPSGTFVALAAGRDHHCALSTEGTIDCWGENDVGQVSATPPGVWAAISAGADHSCALSASGSIACWGGGSAASDAPSESNYVDIGGGQWFGCALTTEGSIDCWGGGAAGAAPTTESFTALAYGGGSESGHGCAITSSENVECWGDDSSGQVSDAPIGSYTAVSAGQAHTCALSTAGTIVCWGSDAQGQCAGSDIAIGISGLLCAIDEESTDDDGDAIGYTFDWDVDGTPYTDTDTTTEDGDTVPGDALGYDETWTCEVTPNDGEDDGESGSASLYIERNEGNEPVPDTIFLVVGRSTSGSNPKLVAYTDDPSDASSWSTALVGEASDTADWGANRNVCLGTYGGAFYLADEDARIWQSEDGADWTEISTAPSYLHSLVTDGEGTWLASGPAGTYRSIDGMSSWTTVRTDGHSLRYGGGIFMLSNGSEYSTDGLDWVTMSGTSGGGGAGYDAATGEWLRVSNSSAYESTDGSDWESVWSGGGTKPTPHWGAPGGYNPTAMDGVWVTSGDSPGYNGDIHYSDDGGVSWDRWGSGNYMNHHPVYDAATGEMIQAKRSWGGPGGANPNQYVYWNNPWESFSPDATKTITGSPFRTTWSGERLWSSMCAMSMNDGIGPDSVSFETLEDGGEEDPSTECNDAIDNDEDGWTDLDDPVCTGITVELEDDGFDPDGPACNDGIDNDADGETDSEDPGCSSASDDNEVG